MAGSVSGAEQIKANLAKYGADVRKALGAAIYTEANNIMAASKRRVPVDTGTLKASGYVTRPQKVGDQILVELGYGGAASKYALYVHEIPSPEEGAPHPEQWTPGKRTARHDPPTTWKYLERPVNERAPQIAANVLALAKAALTMK